MQYTNVVIFGGAGFIGQHFAHHLLDKGKARNIWLADIRRLNVPLKEKQLEKFIMEKKVIHIEVDVRRRITSESLPARDVDLIVNLAAVHREPGHEPLEYYETNLLGARNICMWAESVNCDNMLFTSSIAPYGPSETIKTEESIPVPITPYGGSKLVAETIHLAWQWSDRHNRKLVIVRPGVVFGPGEGGNVARLIKAVLHGAFFYMGNRTTRKAGGYVKELCYTMEWALDQTSLKDESILLYNFSMDPPPSIEEYVESIKLVANQKRAILSVPYSMVLSGAFCLQFFAKLFSVENSFSPVRIRKLVRSNNIVPRELQKRGCQYKYTLRAALEEWRNDRPDEW